MSRQISLWNPSRSASLVSSAGCRRTPGAGAGEVSFSGRHSGRRSVTVVSGPRREGLAVPAVGDFAKTYDLVARIGALSEVAVGPHVRSFNPARGSCQCRASSSSAIAARARELSSVHRRVRAVRAVGQRSCCRRRRARRRAPRGTRVRDLPWRVRRGRARQAPGGRFSRGGTARCPARRQPIGVPRFRWRDDARIGPPVVYANGQRGAFCSGSEGNLAFSWPARPTPS